MKDQYKRLSTKEWGSKPRKAESRSKKNTLKKITSDDLQECHVHWCAVRHRFDEAMMMLVDLAADIRHLAPERAREIDAFLAGKP